MYLNASTISLDNFEGPYDLLLELAATAKIDVSTIALTQIIDAYLTYIATHEVPAALQADFLVVATTLLLLKVRALLPELLPADDEPEITELSDRLRIYQLYREQALALQQHWNTQRLVPGPERLAVAAPIPWPPFTAEDIATALQNVVARRRPTLAPQRHLRPRGRSLVASLALFRERLQQVEQLIFQETVAQEVPETIATSFLAVLELARQQQVQLDQTDYHSPLVVKKVHS